MNARLLLLLALAGCNASVRVDPEGYRCNVGNSCPTGYACRDGFCRASTTVDPSCEGVTCTTPPAASCMSGAMLRTFAGRCVAGQCQYDPVDTTCSTGCMDGACVDPCLGVACVTAPQPACTDTMTLRTFSQTGTCAQGSCEYQPTDTSCPNGCEAGRCKGVDLCVNVTCNMAPAATCVGNTRRAYAASGTCDVGTGVCTYAAMDQACPNGCALGQCLTASLGFSQTGPRVRFAINGLDVAPGSSGNSALAVGSMGRIARWDGSTWTTLTTGLTNTLNKVAFVTGSQAFVVGSGGTALVVRPSAATMQVTPVSLSSSSTSNLVAVSGRGEGEVLVASESGDWWRLRSGSWTNGSLGSTPWVVSGAYLDESLRERIVGSCGSGPGPCVGYRFASGGTPAFVVHTQPGTRPYTAVGGSFDVAAPTGSDALLGVGNNSLEEHTNLGAFSSISPTPALSGAGVVGITAQTVNLGRDVFVLTSSRGPDAQTLGEGHLYRLSRGTLGSVSSTETLTTYFGEEELSPSEANGVLVAEVRRAGGVNNVFRRGVITNEALDVGEDFVGASLEDQGTLVLVSRYGDVVTRAPTASTFNFRRPPTDWSIESFEARNGTGVVMVGEEAAGANGVIVRVTASGFNTQATRAGTTFKAVCRVSDTEGWAVGTGGVIFRVTASAATQVTSPTTKDLLTVDCAAGQGIAAGVDGTVLRLSNGAWTAMSPAFSTTRTITQARLSSAGPFVSGSDFFAQLTGTQWSMLPIKQGLRSLVVRGPQEVYGTVVASGSTEIFRFDGAAWGPRLLQVSGVLGGGVQASSRVVWGGSLGAIVEGR